jgi:hypothetical protein
MHGEGQQVDRRGPFNKPNRRQVCSPIKLVTNNLEDKRSWTDRLQVSPRHLKNDLHGTGDDRNDSRTPLQPPAEHLFHIRHILRRPIPTFIFTGGGFDQRLRLDESHLMRRGGVDQETGANGHRRTVRGQSPLCASVESAECREADGEDTRAVDCDTQDTGAGLREVAWQSSFGSEVVLKSKGNEPALYRTRVT